MRIVHEMLEKFPRLSGIILGIALHPILHQLVYTR